MIGSPPDGRSGCGVGGVDIVCLSGWVGCSGLEVRGEKGQVVMDLGVAAVCSECGTAVLKEHGISRQTRAFTPPPET